MSTFADVLSQVIEQANANRADVSSPRTSAMQANTSVTASPSRVAELERQLARVSLGAEAMWRLLSEHLGFTDQHLLDVVKALDASDGVLDGHFRPAPINCSCGAAINSSSESCQFCGEAADRRRVF